MGHNRSQKPIGFIMALRRAFEHASTASLQEGRHDYKTGDTLCVVVKQRVTIGLFQLLRMDQT
jgi:hypothetical protein